MLRSTRPAPRRATFRPARVLLPLVAALVMGCESSTGPDGTEQTITFEAIGTQILGRTPPALVAATSSFLPVNFTSATTPVCTVNGATLALIAVGTCRINADQPGNEQFAPAARVTVSFDVISCPTVAEGAGVLVGFDDPARSYRVVGFNGASGATASDPTDNCNMVGSVRRVPESQFDGATFGTLPPLDNPTIATIPFTAATNTLTLRVYVPTPNTLVHLKIENAANGTLNYETEVVAPLANTWQTLTFRLDAPLVGGLPGQIFNLATTFNRVSVFFEFGTVRGPTSAVFYFDDLRLVP